jgi:hypothetical protein
MVVGSGRAWYAFDNALAVQRARLLGVGGDVLDAGTFRP